MVLHPRTAIAGKSSRELADALLAISDEESRIAFKGSPMKRAKLRGLKRNASVALANVGNPKDATTATTA